MFDDLLSSKGFGDVNLGKSMNRLNRRDLLKLGVTGILGSVVPVLSSGRAFAVSNHATWRVSFRHGHTGEGFSGVYRVGDKYLPEAFERLNYVMRDFRTGEVFPMDPRVIDIISLVQGRLGYQKPLEVLSGYRSPKTNAMLRRASTGVAKNSFHMYGQAIDFRAHNHKTSRIQKAAKNLRAGGVGYYPKSDFVHVDTGSIRSW